MPEGNPVCPSGRLSIGLSSLEGLSFAKRVAPTKVKPWPKFVAVGNLLATRSVLLMRLMAFKGGRFFLEQPSSSLVSQISRFQDLARDVDVGHSSAD